MLDSRPGDQYSTSYGNSVCTCRSHFGRIRAVVGRERFTSSVDCRRSRLWVRGFWLINEAGSQRDLARLLY